MMSSRSCGRGRLPMCVVWMRSVLFCIPTVTSLAKLELLAAERSGLGDVRPLPQQLFVIRHVALPQAVDAHAAHHVERGHHQEAGFFFADAGTHEGVEPDR